MVDFYERWLRFGLPGDEASWARLESARTDLTEARPGDEITVETVLAPYRGERVVKQISIKIPTSASKGPLRILVSDGDTLDRMRRGMPMMARKLDLASTIALLSATNAKWAAAGLGSLPIRTVMQAEKVTRNVMGNMVVRSLFGQPVVDRQVSGYEIHIGQTIYPVGAAPFAVLSEGANSSCSHNDGCVSTDSRVFGTYLHGLFDDDSFRHQFLGAARAFHELAPASELCPWRQLREESLDRLAREVEKALDMKTIFGWIGLPYGVPLKMS